MFALAHHRARAARTGVPLASALLLALVLLVGLVAPGGSVPGADAATTWVPQQGVKFNVARAGDRQYIIERQVIDAINHAAPGSYIKMSMFSYDRHPVTDALLRARKRGVYVQVLVNRHERPSAQARLQNALGSNRSRRNFYYQCAASCRGQSDILHSKFVLFSKTGATTNTVMLGSANMKQNATDNQFNDWVTFNRQRTLHATLDAVFKEMAADRYANPMRIAKVIGTHLRLDVMPFPRDSLATDATRWTVSRDPVMRLLAPIRCKGATTSTGRTVIRVDMQAWDGERGKIIARRFKALYDAGCDVRLSVGFIPRTVKSILYASTGRGRVPLRSSAYDTDYDGEFDLYSHTKNVLIHGRYGDSTNLRIVLTGSSNFQDGGQYGDELFFRMTDMPNVYKRYLEHWWWMWDHHTHSMP